MNRGDWLLRFDWTGAAVVGVVTLSLHPWLSELGGLPPGVLITAGMVNLAYAAYSLSLWIRPTRPLSRAVVLVLANLAWSAICVGLLVVCRPSITPLGVLHLGGEAIWVGALAVLEWRHLDSMARGPTTVCPDRWPALTSASDLGKARNKDPGIDHRDARRRPAVDRARGRAGRTGSCRDRLHERALRRRRGPLRAAIRAALR